VGISDRHHFAWLTGALTAFEGETGRFAAFRRECTAPVLWCLAARRRDPVLDWIARAMGSGAQVTLFDKFPEGASGSQDQDINALANLPDNGCDVLTLLRASYFITDPAAFLTDAWRIVRPHGLVVIDWLHGLSNAPVLDLHGDPRYGGEPTPFMTTYADAQMLSDFSDEFEAFILPLDSRPWWANVERPGVRVRLSERVQRLLGLGPQRALTLTTYLAACRAELARAGKHLIEPESMEQHFKVIFRHARYFYPHVRKFNLYLLTVLEPLGK